MTTSSAGLKRRVAVAGLWTVILRICDHGLRTVRTIILARILLPEQFGLFGISLLVLSSLGMFLQTGFQAALIQKREDIEPYLDTGWTVQFLRGLALCLLTYILAPFAAGFLGEPDAVTLIRAAGLTAALRGAESIRMVLFLKELNFRKRFIYRMTTTVFEVGVSLSAGVILRSPIALVYGLIAGRVAAVAASYFLQPYLPRIRFDAGKAKELFRFGRWILGSNLTYYLVTHGDDWLVGRVLGATSLGLYQLAYRISELPVSEVSSVVRTVAFPAYSMMQDDPARLRRACLQTFEFVAAVGLPIALGIALIAFDFTAVFLGDEWMPMVPAMIVLSFSGLLQVLTAPMGSLFWAIGKPRVGLFLNSARLAVMLGLLFPATQYGGILGTAAVVVLASFAKLPVFFHFAREGVGIRPRDFARSVIWAVFASGLSFGLVEAGTQWAQIDGLWRLVLRGALFGLFYLAISWTLAVRRGVGPIMALRRVWDGLRKEPT